MDQRSALNERVLLGGVHVVSFACASIPGESAETILKVTEAPMAIETSHGAEGAAASPDQGHLRSDFADCIPRDVVDQPIYKSTLSATITFQTSDGANSHVSAV